MASTTASRGNSRRVCALAIGLVIALAACTGPGSAPSATVEASQAATTAPSGSAAPSATDSAEWQQILEQANAEGRVVLYASKAPDQLAALGAEFDRQYPNIKFEYFQASSGKIATRFNTELEAGHVGGDVISQSDGFWAQDLATNGHVAPIAGPLKAEWKPEYVQDGILWVAAEVAGLVYNTDLVKTPPTAVDSLIDPQYTGQVILQKTGSSSDNLYYENLGDEWLRRVAALNPRFVSTNIDTANALAAGEVAWSFSAITPFLAQKAKGAPIDVWTPVEGASIVRQFGFVPQEAPHPAAAQVLMNFLMSEKAQEMWSGSDIGISFLGDIPGTRDVDLATAKVLEKRHTEQAFQNEFDRKWDSIFKP